MRVSDVMSSPVVCVPPDRRLKDVADLLPLEVAPDPRAHLASLPEPRPQVRQVVTEVMTRAVVALAEDADVAEAGG